MNPFTVNSYTVECILMAFPLSSASLYCSSFSRYLLNKSFHFTYHFLFQLIKWCLLLRFCKLFSCNTKFDSKVAYLLGIDSLENGSVIYSIKKFSNVSFNEV